MDPTETENEQHLPEASATSPISILQIGIPTQHVIPDLHEDNQLDPTRHLPLPIPLLPLIARIGSTIAGDERSLSLYGTSATHLLTLPDL